MPRFRRSTNITDVAAERENLVSATGIHLRTKESVDVNNVGHRSLRASEGNGLYREVGDVERGVKM